MKAVTWHGVHDVRVDGGQAECLRVPQAQFGPVKVPEGPPDDRFVYLGAFKVLLQS